MDRRIVTMSVKRIYRKLDFRMRLSSINMILGKIGLVLVVVDGDDDLPIELHLTTWKSFIEFIKGNKEKIQ